jgi:4-hydroxybenzoate polyprenyltransferase
MNDAVRQVPTPPGPRRNAVVAALVALRPKQWTKNLLLFAGLLFTLDQRHGLRDFERAALGFVLFSLLSGVAYLINDVVDVERDRSHPTKRYRPIAAGELGARQAIILAIALIVVVAVFSGMLGLRFEAAAGAYLVITLSYSFLLKHIVILDVISLALGFVLRAVAGAWAIPVAISPWLVLCTFELALFLGISKRRGELVAVLAGRKSGRPILEEYTADMLDQMGTIVTSALVMSYALYTIQSPSALKHHYLMATNPFVLYGIFRYIYLIHRHSLGEAPDEVLLKDKPLLVNVALWALTTGLIVMHVRPLQ